MFPMDYKEACRTASSLFRSKEKRDIHASVTVFEGEKYMKIIEFEPINDDIMIQTKEDQLREQEVATLKKIGYELERGFEDLIGILRDIRQELSFINTHEIAEAIAPDSEPAIPIPPSEEAPEPQEQAEPEKAENTPPNRY